MVPRRRFFSVPSIPLVWTSALNGDRKNLASALNALQAAAPPIELGSVHMLNNLFLPLFGACAWRGILSSRTRQCRCCRVSEDSRPQRDRLELLDGSVSASGRGSCEHFAGEKLVRPRCRCCPHSSARRLQRFPHALERRRPRHPHPERSQGRLRETTVATKYLPPLVPRG